MVGPRVKVLSRGGACSRKEAVRFVRRVSSRGWVGGEEVRIEETGNKQISKIWYILNVGKYNVGK